MKNICIVEDNEDLIYFYKDLLSTEDYSVHIATSLAALSTLLTNNTYDTVLADFILKDGDFLNWIMINDSSFMERIPTIMISSHCCMETMRSAFKLGAMDFIVKPFERQELLAKLEKVLQLSTSQIQNDSFLKQLTETERSIYLFLLHHKENFVSREQIEEVVWEGVFVGKKNLNVHLNNLRKKLLLKKEETIFFQAHKGWQIRSINKVKKYLLPQESNAM